MLLPDHDDKISQRALYNAYDKTTEAWMVCKTFYLLSRDLTGSIALGSLRSALLRLRLPTARYLKWFKRFRVLPLLQNGKIQIHSQKSQWKTPDRIYFLPRTKLQNKLTRQIMMLYHPRRTEYGLSAAEDPGVGEEGERARKECRETEGWSWW
ncbi:hypothetical protein FRC05_010963 [Tulasnella sp. 425]|nr:hypothetical protein FRC05_010963 [Tulasnella sp. 425]